MPSQRFDTGHKFGGRRENQTHLCYNVNVVPSIRRLDDRKWRWYGYLQSAFKIDNLVCYLLTLYHHKLIFRYDYVLQSNNSWAPLIVCGSSVWLVIALELTSLFIWKSGGQEGNRTPTPVRARIFENRMATITSLDRVASACCGRLRLKWWVFSVLPGIILFFREALWLH